MPYALTRSSACTLVSEQLPAKLTLAFIERDHPQFVVGTSYRDVSVGDVVRSPPL